MPRKGPHKTGPHNSKRQYKQVYMTGVRDTITYAKARIMPELMHMFAAQTLVEKKLTDLEKEMDEWISSRLT